MLTKIKNLKYTVLAKYLFVGVIVAVFVFQVVTVLLSNTKLVFNSIINIETLELIISVLFGAFVGGAVYTVMSVNDKNRELKERNLWNKRKDKKNRWLFIRNVIPFSLAGFAGLLTKSILKMNTYTPFFQSLFSSENTIRYIGIVLAASVLAILFTIGIDKRLKILYNN